MVTMIGNDPHKATHTAAAVDETEQVIGEGKMTWVTGRSVRSPRGPQPGRTGRYTSPSRR